MKQGIIFKMLITAIALVTQACPCYAQDTTALEKVSVSAVKLKNRFTMIMPSQYLDKLRLQQLNAASAGDAARFFAGVQVKDYGGIGGLKTVSVRSLGAAHTGVSYDGLPVSDAQSGQIDLSRFSSTFLQSIELSQANPEALLQPARALSATSYLSLQTTSSTPIAFQKKKITAGIFAGSFGQVRPFAGISIPLSKNTTAGFNTEFISTRGNYPFIIENGNLSQKTKRENSKVRSLHGEGNLTTQFKDSALLQLKISGYASKRGLPGAVVFFNNRSVQQLWNEDYFAQARYKKTWNKKTNFLLAAKASTSHTRYTDPDFLNNQGGLDNHYRQQEFYGTTAISQEILPALQVALASDISLSKLSANVDHFVQPRRTYLWNSIAAGYDGSLFRINGSLLWSHVNDETTSAKPADVKNKITPTLALSAKASAESPWMLRLFYKDVFRMPTFNDLYYNFIGNSSLKPEQAKQYNAGITFSRQSTGSLRQIKASTDVYYNSINNKIIAVPNKNLFVWTMLNLGKVRIRGLDVAAEMQGIAFKNISWFSRIAYTFQHAFDITDPGAANYKNRISYTPDHSGSVLLTAQWKSWTAGYSLLFSGTRYTLGENNPFNELKGWGTQDLFVARKFSVRQNPMQCKFELNNFTNNHYDIVRYYPMPGRSYTISIIYNNL